jgi:hypothetical protein
VTRAPWWYRYRLGEWREHVAGMTDGELNRARTEIADAVAACDRQGARGADAAFANTKKLRVVEYEIERRNGAAPYVPPAPRAPAPRGRPAPWRPARY